MLLQRAKAHLKNYQFCALILLFTLAPLGAQAQLSPEVEFDLTVRELETAIEHNNWSEAKKLLYRLDKLEIELPPVMNFYKAKAWLEEKNELKALGELEIFLGKVDSSHTKYTAALDLYSYGKQLWKIARGRHRDQLKSYNGQFDQVKKDLELAIRTRYILMNKNFPMDRFGGTSLQEMETADLSRIIGILQNQLRNGSNSRVRNDARVGLSEIQNEYLPELRRDNKKIQKLEAKKKELLANMRAKLKLLRNEYDEGKY
ncbi:hypothetical protein KFE96_06200 [Kordiimonas sp. SCSIO 12603]|uniref:hypothetical protein n=1 Tax=Kordiimonas sp. SCSIO 12603 TaxID=2829596 RepID=UPI002102A459|nr:hypothetical protein [Kordiimonas sp. SCSIO 12603]UTW59891.1 hypothetical protein KFE96_06200 [Kordiimonas sp. SCSIO 12603]